MKRLLALLAILFLAVTPAMAQRRVEGTIAALGGTVRLSTTGTGNGAIQVTGTWTGTINLKATLDGTNWITLALLPAGSTTTVTDITANGVWTYSGAFAAIRAESSGGSFSGTATIQLLASYASSGGRGGGAVGSGNPGGSLNDIQINAGGGNFGGYAGDTCGAGDFATGVNSAGTLTCDTPAGGGTVTSVSTADQGLAVTNPTSTPSINTKATNNAGSLGATPTIDWANGRVQLGTLTANATFTFSNPISGQIYFLVLVQDATGGFTITWPGTVVWLSGTAPKPDTTATTRSAFLFAYDGTNYNGIHLQAGKAYLDSLVTGGTAGPINLTDIAAGSAPSAGTTDIYPDNTSKLLCAKNTTLTSCTNSANNLIRGIGFELYDSSALTTGRTSYVTVPFACTLSAYTLQVDAGTVTVKFWKVATGTSAPTVSNSINTSGVSISTGTAIRSTTMTDFTTTTVSANDMMAMNITAVSTAKSLSGVLQCDQ